MFLCCHLITLLILLGCHDALEHIGCVGTVDITDATDFHNATITCTSAMAAAMYPIPSECSWIIKALPSETLHLEIRAATASYPSGCLNVSSGDKETQICTNNTEDSILIKGSGKIQIRWDVQANVSINYFAWVDWCARQNPCINGGTCLASVSNTSCVCPLQWTGEHCETDMSNISTIKEVSFLENASLVESQEPFSTLNQRVAPNAFNEGTQIPQSSSDHGASAKAAHYEDKHSIFTNQSKIKMHNSAINKEENGSGQELQASFLTSASREMQQEINKISPTTYGAVLPQIKKTGVPHIFTRNMYLQGKSSASSTVTLHSENHLLVPGSLASPTGTPVKLNPTQSTNTERTSKSPFQITSPSKMLLESSQKDTPALVLAVKTEVMHDTSGTVSLLSKEFHHTNRLQMKKYISVSSTPQRNSLTQAHISVRTSEPHSTSAVHIPDSLTTVYGIADSSKKNPSDVDNTHISTAFRILSTKGTHIPSFSSNITLNSMESEQIQNIERVTEKNDSPSSGRHTLLQNSDIAVNDDNAINSSEQTTLFTWEPSEQYKPADASEETVTLSTFLEKAMEGVSANTAALLHDASLLQGYTKSHNADEPATEPYLYISTVHSKSISSSTEEGEMTNIKSAISQIHAGQARLHSSAHLVTSLYDYTVNALPALSPMTKQVQAEYGSHLVATPSSETFAESRTTNPVTTEDTSTAEIFLPKKTNTETSQNAEYFRKHQPSDKTTQMTVTPTTMERIFSSASENSQQHIFTKRILGITSSTAKENLNRSDFSHSSESSRSKMSSYVSLSGSQVLMAFSKEPKLFSNKDTKNTTAVSIFDSKMPSTEKGSTSVITSLGDSSKESYHTYLQTSENPFSFTWMSLPASKQTSQTITYDKLALPVEESTVLTAILVRNKTQGSDGMSTTLSLTQAGSASPNDVTKQINVPNATFVVQLSKEATYTTTASYTTLPSNADLYVMNPDMLSSVQPYKDSSSITAIPEPSPSSPIPGYTEHMLETASGSSYITTNSTSTWLVLISDPDNSKANTATQRVTDSNGTLYTRNKQTSNPSTWFQKDDNTQNVALRMTAEMSTHKSFNEHEAVSQSNTTDYITTMHMSDSSFLTLDKILPTMTATPDEEYFAVTDKDSTKVAGTLQLHMNSSSPKPITSQTGATNETMFSTGYSLSTLTSFNRKTQIFIAEDQLPILKEQLIRIPQICALQHSFSNNSEYLRSQDYQTFIQNFTKLVVPFYELVPGFQRLEKHKISRSTLLEYDAVFKAELIRAQLPDIDLLLNMTGLAQAVTSELRIGDFKVINITVAEKKLDLCAMLFSCHSGFECVHDRWGNATCTSLCHRNYCKNNGICTHEHEHGPMCQCPVGSDYWFMGLRCDYRMTKQRLVGISLAVVFSIIVMMVLVAYLVMRRVKALVIEAVTDQTKSSYRRFARFDDIASRYWSQSWLASSANSLDNPGYSNSDDELIHLQMLSSCCSCQRNSFPLIDPDLQSIPSLRTALRYSLPYDWDLSSSTINEQLADSGKASDLSVSSWPMEPIHWTPLPILQQLSINKRLKARRPRSYCEGMDMTNIEKSWTA
ncbi:mucin-12-like isoform X2 [Protopterus annectens]|uniref:mucin-12-like isoform X2 n=1 Tax=Protopterus annectens TaxID=7888 RepID=UPI001CF9A390|nr:mucin-12-like isoform X2 [Protopterus annectens]